MGKGLSTSKGEVATTATRRPSPGRRHGVGFPLRPRKAAPKATDEKLVRGRLYPRTGLVSVMAWRGGQDG